MKKLSKILVNTTVIIFCLLFIMLCFILVFWLFELNLNDRFLNVFWVLVKLFFGSLCATILIYRED